MSIERPLASSAKIHDAAASRTAEHVRLEEARGGRKWRRWGTYVSERQWGTVREDYSRDGDAWGYFTHEMAQSRVYRWGEDGLFGFCDNRGLFHFALALWNGKDSCLKERLFGLSGPESNHGECVQELYWYLDATPTGSYSRALYKYPQRAFPYDTLRALGRSRTRSEPSPRIAETGIFAEDRYFDVGVEYAKAGPEDVLVRITIENRGPDPAPIDVLPTFWFRNTWSWTSDLPRRSKPVLQSGSGAGPTIEGKEPFHGDIQIWLEQPAELLFTNNDTNVALLFDAPNESPWVKDAFHAAVCRGERQAVNPEGAGTKAAGRFSYLLAAGETRVVRVRMRMGSGASEPLPATPFGDFDDVLARRRNEADAFYATVTPPAISSGTQWNARSHAAYPRAPDA